MDSHATVPARGLPDSPAKSSAVEQRLLWFKRTLLGAFFLGFLFCPKLWLSERSFPLCPVSSRLPAISRPLGQIWFALILGLLVISLLAARPGKYLVGFVLCVVSLGLWDQLRWQPWVYEYLLLSATLTICFWRQGNDPNERGAAALDTCRLVLVTLYFFSGLHKLNPAFGKEVLPYIFAATLPHLSPAVYGALGLAMALLESGIGLGLLTRRWRHLAILCAAAMHAVILLCIGPLGRSHNSVVWPWNLAMILFVAILFYRTKETTWQTILLPRGRSWHALVAVLCGVLPVLNFAGLWDSYLSANLYSNTVARAYVLIPAPFQQGLPAELQPYLRPYGRRAYYLDFVDWALGELNVPPNPERRIYRRLAEYVCRVSPAPQKLTLDLEERPRPWSEEARISYFDCSGRAAARPLR